MMDLTNKTGPALPALTQPQAAAKPDLQPDLHDQIMRLPAKPDNEWPGGEQHAYTLGHRDARHAAAELVSAQPPAQPAAPAAPASIDTPEFSVALAVWMDHLDYYQDAEHEVVKQSRAAIIAHIDAAMAQHGQQQREAGQQAGWDSCAMLNQERFRQKDEVITYEQRHAAESEVALAAEKDRADRAEAALARIVAGVDRIVRWDRSDDGMASGPGPNEGRFAEFDDILALLPAKAEAPLTHNPHTGAPRDLRDIASDPQAVLCVAPGAPLRAAQQGAELAASSYVQRRLKEVEADLERERDRRIHASHQRTQFRDAADDLAICIAAHFGVQLDQQDDPHARWAAALALLPAWAATTQEIRAVVAAPAMDEELPPPVAIVSKGVVAFFVKWTEAGKPLQGVINLFTEEQLRACMALRQPLAPFQARVQPWLLECFGAEIAADRVERNHRFLEEAIELAQACNCTAGEAHQLVDYVFGRPVGEPAQEVGGVMVTLAALCLAHGMDMAAASETELARIWTKVEAIRAKQAAKPKHGPLPAAPAAGRCEHCDGTGDVHRADGEWLGACSCGAAPAQSDVEPTRPPDRRRSAAAGTALAWSEPAAACDICDNTGTAFGKRCSCAITK